MNDINVVVSSIYNVGSVSGQGRILLFERQLKKILFVNPYKTSRPNIVERWKSKGIMLP